MKAISLWQPWAAAIFTGAKTYETRRWPTNYRGPLIIHAAKRWTLEQRTYLSYWHWVGALAPLIGHPLDLSGTSWHTIPEDTILLGYALGVVELTACVRTDGMTQAEIGTDRHFGNFSLGRYAWKLENLRFPWKPFRAKGNRVLFELDPPPEIK